MLLFNCTCWVPGDCVVLHPVRLIDGSIEMCAAEPGQLTIASHGAVVVLPAGVSILCLDAIQDPSTYLPFNLLHQVVSGRTCLGKGPMGPIKKPRLESGALK